MIEHLSEYIGLPRSTDDIPPGDDIWVLPYIRFVADGLCEDPTDKDKLQLTLWQLDRMSAGEIMDLYNQYQAKLASQTSENL